MARSSLGLVCAMALAVLCSARRSNQGWGWGGKAEDKLQTEDPKPEDPKPGWVDWAAVAEKAKATGMSMKDAAVGMGVYAKETAEDWVPVKLRSLPIVSIVVPFWGYRLGSLT